jgi:hypothetical protein
LHEEKGDDIVFWHKDQKLLKRLLFFWLALSAISLIYGLIVQQLLIFMVLILSLLMSITLFLTRKFLIQQNQYELRWSRINGNLSIYSLKKKSELILSNINAFKELNLNQIQNIYKNQKINHYQLRLKDQNEIIFVLDEDSSEKELIKTLWQLENEWAIFRLDHPNIPLTDINDDMRNQSLSFPYDLSKSRLLSFVFLLLMLSNLWIFKILGFSIEGSLFLGISFLMLLSLMLSYFADRFFYATIYIDENANINIQKCHIPSKFNDLFASLKLSQRLSKRLTKTIHIQDYIDLVYYPIAQNRLKISLYYRNPKKTDQMLKIDLYEDILDDFTKTQELLGLIQKYSAYLKSQSLKNRPALVEIDNIDGNEHSTQAKPS